MTLTSFRHVVRDSKSSVAMLPRTALRLQKSSGATIKFAGAGATSTRCFTYGVRLRAMAHETYALAHPDCVGSRLSPTRIMNNLAILGRSVL